ncbi:hypothetical protein [Micromonospora sp. MA102]|uniref:hypothetical protein n=1 Tax=Micromonospora sp. MA102 TaxID=2952755 RepID=UPI0021C961FF|nr:hypothetical protein [Micromonospora sp. MA102]
MPRYIQQGLGLLGFGLLLGFFGLIQMVNLFGVVDEHARQIGRSPLTRWVEGREVPAEEIRRRDGFVLGRYIVGTGFLLVGLLAVGGGIVFLVTPPGK